MVTARLSLNCADARELGVPDDQHINCTGCGCTCHFVPMPPDFRDRLEAAKGGEDR